MTDVYKPTPTYYWYRTKQHVDGGYHKYYYKGVQYVGYADEPDYEAIDRYNLQFVGTGDINFINKR